jgi:hypothetical protein
MKRSNCHWQQLKQGERTIPETSTIREGKTTRSSKNPLKFIVETKKKNYDLFQFLVHRLR